MEGASSKHAYSSTLHSETGLAPYFVVLGPHAHLLVDQAAGLVRPGQSPCMIGQRHDHLRSVYQLVKEWTQQRQQQDQGQLNRSHQA